MLQIAICLATALGTGLVLGWFVRSARDKRQTGKLRDKWQIKYDEAARQRDRFNAENTKLRTSIDAQQAVVHKREQAVSNYQTELASAAEQLKSLSRDLFSCRAERDDYQRTCNDRQDALAAATRQLASLEAEFARAGEFYKGELRKSLDKRKELASSLDDARAEHESLTTLLQAAQHEKESVNKMLAAAQTRLDNMDAMEHDVIALEAENARFRHEEAGMRQQIEVLQRDVAELEALKVQNRELAHCLKSMESSRRQYELDAQRYREKADHSERRSETLSMKLDDVEKSFAAMARRHDEALAVVADHAPAGKSNGKDEPAEREVDDLTKIVGIGKVFEQMLHDLGIYSYRQIATFGPADIARVNTELKEFRGRMEQDDWVGQAKELYYQKCSAADGQVSPTDGV